MDTLSMQEQAATLRIEAEIEAEQGRLLNAQSMRHAAITIQNSADEITRLRKQIDDKM